MDYKLSNVLTGHFLDVRGLAVTPEGFIVSVSRDKTVKLWKPNSENNGFTNVQTYKHHHEYILCTTVLNNSEVLPYGIILTSGYDKKICGYIPQSPEPILIETGHKQTVCKLNPGVLPNTFISSSWDTTARLWHIFKESEQCFKALLIAVCNGHSMSVCSAIQLPTKHIVTASADKTIYVHLIVSAKCNKSTTIVNRLTGHTDCVRDLAVLTDIEFLSCSNDATVKRWNLLTGECLETFHGHPSYIYSLCVFRDQLNSTVITGGEDRYVNVRQSSNQQVILQPAQSIWAVTVLPNSDIVIGSSDGVIRIFSTDFKRQASKEVLSAFQREVNPGPQKKIGGIQVDSLPGPEVLLMSGKSDGQIIMVNENGKPVAYKWLSNETKWVKIGVNLSRSDKFKPMHEGKEYDFVWNVDIGDGHPPLKLPFNKIEEPWLVAEQFIHKHYLQQLYTIDAIEKLIISNSKCNPDKLTATKLLNTDKYKIVATSEPTSSKEVLFPQTDYIKFDIKNQKIQLIFDKLELFNKDLKGDFYKLSENDRASLLRLLELDAVPDMDSINLLMNLVCDWPDDILFPILDILRLAVRNEHVNDILCIDDNIMMKLLPHIHNIKNPMNQMISIRCLCNLMQYKTGELLVLKYYEGIIEFIQKLDMENMSEKHLQTLNSNIINHYYTILNQMLSNRELMQCETGELLVLKYYEEMMTFIQKVEMENVSQKHLQIAISTFLLNVTVMMKQSDNAVAIQNIANTINVVCLKLNEPIAMLRCFIAIGTLLSLKNPPTLSEQIQDYIKLMASSNSEHLEVLDCCKDIMAILRKKYY